jgi:hypothetical protein
MSFETLFDANHQVKRCTGYPQDCAGCWNNPCRLKEFIETKTRIPAERHGNFMTVLYMLRALEHLWYREDKGDHGIWKEPIFKVKK